MHDCELNVRDNVSVYSTSRENKRLIKYCHSPPGLNVLLVFASASIQQANLTVMKNCIGKWATMKNCTGMCEKGYGNICYNCKVDLALFIWMVC